MGASWREGAAADPYDLLATSEGLLMTSIAGLSVTTDTGESFQPVEGAPSLALLADAEDTVIGVDLNGTLWRPEPGMQWTPEGTTPEQIHALALLPGGEVKSQESPFYRSVIEMPSMASSIRATSAAIRSIDADPGLCWEMHWATSKRSRSESAVHRL